MIGAGGLIGRVLIDSHDPPVHPNRVPVNRGGRVVVVVVLDLDLHAPKPLPVSPLQHEIRRRRLSDGLGASSQQQRRICSSSYGSLSTVRIVYVGIIINTVAPQRVLIHLVLLVYTPVPSHRS